MNSMKVKKGDKVQVIAGGTRVRGHHSALRSYPQPRCRRRLRHREEGRTPHPAEPAGRHHSMEAPIHVSNVMLVCPSCGKPVRTGSASTTRAKRSASARSAVKTSTRNSPPVE